MWLKFFSLQDDDNDDEDSEEDRDTPSYTAISNTPTRITLTAKVSQKRKRGPNKIKDQNVIHVWCLFCAFSHYVGLSYYFWSWCKLLLFAKFPVFISSVQSRN